MRHVDIYTDGACLDNPGPGGWACILIYNGISKMHSGYEEHTTNNRMELQAVVCALRYLTEGCEVTLTTDSKYVVDAIEKGWLENWIKKNQLQSRPNADLWNQLVELLRIQQVKFVWTKGHAGNKYNEMCDTEASARAKEIKHKLKNYTQF